MTISVPGFPFTEEKDFGLIVSDFSAGPIMRGLRRPNSVRTFRYTAPLETQALQESVFTDHTNEVGRAGNFAYTPTALSEGATTVRFGMDEIQSQYRGGPAGHEIEIVLHEDMTGI